jgi:hypothetical protein
MAHDLGVGGVFPQSGDKDLAPAHGFGEKGILAPGGGLLSGGRLGR